MTNGGISDKIQLLKEAEYGDGGTSGEEIFGVTRSVSWTLETNTNQSYGLETAGPAATVNTDGVVLVTGTHEFELTDGRALRAIMGSITDGGAGTFSLDVSNALPSYSMKVVDDESESKYLIIKGIKYGRMSITLTRDETILISADFLGQTIENTATFTPTCSDVEPLVFLDGYVQFGGTKQSGIDNFSIELNRNVVARRYIEQTTTGNRRLISSLIEGLLNLTYNGSQTAKREVIEEIWGDSTIADVRSDKNLVLVCSRGTSGLTLTMTGGRHVSVDRTLDKNEEVALANFSGLGIDISGSGTYPTD